MPITADTMAASLSLEATSRMNVPSIFTLEIGKRLAQISILESLR